MSGCSTRGLAPGAVALGRRGGGVQGGERAGGVHDLGGGAVEDLVEDVGHGAPAAHRAVGGDDGDRAGGAAGLERGEQVGLVGAGDDQGDGAAALAEPLGEREERGGGVPLADQQAADRLLGQRERPAERAGDLDPGAGGEGREPAGAGPDGLDDELEGGAVPAHGLDPVDPEAAPGEPGLADRERDEGAGAEALGDAGRRPGSGGGRRRPS